MVAIQLIYLMVRFNLSIGMQLFLEKFESWWPSAWVVSFWSIYYSTTFFVYSVNTFVP
jgi:hypothetical protein